MTENTVQSVPTPSVATLLEAPVRRRSFIGQAWRRLVRNPLALLGLAVVGLFVFLAIFADQVAP